MTTANNLLEDSRSVIIQASFSPRIAIFSSQDVNRICEKNHLPNFVSLLRPFESIDRVSVCQSNFSTAVINSFRLSFFDADDLFSNDQSKLDQPDWIDATLNQSIFTNKKVANWIDTFSANAAPSTLSHSSVIQNFKLKNEHEWLGSEIAENEEYPQPSTPWYMSFLNSLLEHRPLVDYDQTSHPLAAWVVVSTNNPEPLNEFAELYEKSGQGGSGWPNHNWLETGTILRYYLLIHEINDEPDGGKAGASELLDSIKRAYGLNCGLLCINSEKTDWLRKKRIVDRDPHFIHSDSPINKQDHWLRYQIENYDENNQMDQNVTFGEFISEEDVLALKIILREFTLQSLIPHIERCVQHWNDTLVASRKGITGRLFSVGKKYFTKTSGSTSSSPTTTSSQYSYNPITRSYPHQSQEAQTRRLADFSFILGDYKYASQMYDYVRKDAFSDKAWAYYSSANQMIGLCTLLQSSFSQRSKLNVNLDYFLFDHAVVTRSASQLRMVMIYHEMAKAIGNSHLMSTSLIRVATLFGNLLSGLIYEQISRITPLRQGALYTILAAHYYHFARQKWLSEICFKQRFPLGGWNHAENHLDMRVALLAQDELKFSVAALQYWNIIRRQLKAKINDFLSAEDESDMLYVASFESAFRKAIEANHSFVLPGTGDIKLVDVECCRIRVPQQEHLCRPHSCINPNIWTDLITKYPNSSTPSVAPVDENTAIVNEPFYADLLFKNPLGAPIKVTDIRVTVISLDKSSGLDNPSDASFVDFQPLSDLKLLPREERQVSLALLCAIASQKLEITHVHYKFHSLVDCSQSLKKKGKRLQNTLSERLNRVYSIDRSMQVYVRTEIPILEITGFENFDKEIYAGESVFGEIKIQNVGKVKMKNLRCIISHDSFFRICTQAELADQKRPTLYQTNCTPEDPLIIETSNHLVNDSPALLAEELEIDGRTRSLVLCRGEKVGQHNIYWLFTFQLATTGEFLTFRHVQHLLVVPSLEVRPFIRPSVTENAFYLLTVEIDNVGFPEDVEIHQVSTIGLHWSSNCLHFDPNSSHIVTLPAGSRSTTLAFEILPWEEVDEDPTTSITLKQLEKIFKKEKLEAEFLNSSIKTLACSAHPASQPTIRVDSPILLNTITSSHRTLRLEALRTHFTTLTPPQIFDIFPLISANSLDLIIFWRTFNSERIGHHHISDLKFGATKNIIEKTLRNFKGKSGGIYYESQVEQKLLIKQCEMSEFGRWQNPLTVDLEVSKEFFEWDFEKNGPLKVDVKFLLKNLSTSSVSFRVDLIRDLIPRKARDHDIEESSNLALEPTEWIGKMNFKGKLNRLEKTEIQSQCWVFKPSLIDVGNWKCQSSNNDEFLQLESEKVQDEKKAADNRNQDKIESPIWDFAGNQKILFISNKLPSSPN